MSEPEFSNMIFRKIKPARQSKAHTIRCEKGILEHIQKFEEKFSRVMKCTTVLQTKQKECKLPLTRYLNKFKTKHPKDLTVNFPEGVHKYDFETITNLQMNRDIFYVFLRIDCIKVFLGIQYYKFNVDILDLIFTEIFKCPVIKILDIEYAELAFAKKLGAVCDFCTSRLISLPDLALHFTSVQKGYLFMDAVHIGKHAFQMLAGNFELSIVDTLKNFFPAGFTY